jgi:hypothetical protein
MIFPSGSSTTDGWNYAAEIRYAGEIFHPHHLLYNAFGYIICFLPSKAGISVLGCLKALNAVFAVLTLLVLQMIYRRLGKNEVSIILLSCLAGFSFSVMRFATENETYIIPFFLALTASYNYLKFTHTSNQKYAVYSGVWATLSVLFHQIFIFWWLGILVGIILSRKMKPIIWYCIISVTGPLIYLIVILNVSGNLKWETIIGFISGDFRNNAQLVLTGKGLFFSGVNFVRSFIQVHGYILNMIRSHFLLIAPCIITLVLFLLALLKLPVKNINRGVSDFALIHILIIVLQFLFAMIAAGNAEFMIMIPALGFILIGIIYSNYEKFFLRIMAGMAIWNISYGIIPLHFDLPVAEEFLCNAALEDKHVMVIASDDQLLKSMIYYQTGERHVDNIVKSPAVLELRGTDIRFLEHDIDSMLYTGSIIYTDCIGVKTVSRSSISEGKINKDFFSKYKTVEIKSWKSIMGRKFVSRIEAKL